MGLAHHVWGCIWLLAFKMAEWPKYVRNLNHSRFEVRARACKWYASLNPHVSHFSTISTQPPFCFPAPQPHIMELHGLQTIKLCPRCRQAARCGTTTRGAPVNHHFVLTVSWVCNSNPNPKYFSMCFTYTVWYELELCGLLKRGVLLLSC